MTEMVVSYCQNNEQGSDALTPHSLTESSVFF
jgi:hypothetical protein